MGIPADIIAGAHDGDLDSLREAIRDREKALASAKRFSVKTGDTVRFADSIRPKYLVGLPATVTKVNRESVLVDCPDDDAYGRFASVKGVRCPLSIIDL